jgi:uncharacterized protein involved in exopolysaccharide biosynthesis
MMQVQCIARAFWKHSLVMVVSIVAVAALAIHAMPKMFVATATLLVNHDTKDPLARQGGGPNVDEVPLTFIPTQIELITSTVVLQPVIDKLDLMHDKQFAGGFKGTPAALREAVMRNLQQALVVLQGRGSQLLYISASYPSPERAAQIANAIAEVYLKQERQRVNEPAGERASRYSQDLSELRAKADAAQDRVTEFRLQHGLTDVEAGNDVEVTALNELEGKLLLAQNQRRELEAHQLDPDAGSEQALDSQAVAALRGQLAAEQQRMGELLATLGPKYPTVIELQSQINATKRSIENEVQSISSNTKTALVRVRELEQKFQAAVDAQRGKVVERRALQDQAGKLLVELASAKDTYRRALEGYDQTLFASVTDNADVSLVSRAEPPVKAEKPNKVKLFLVACIAALGIGVGGPFVYELLLDRRLRCRDDLERNFGMPVLAQLGPIRAVRA